MKKAEIQMQETILVIFIVTVIIALGLFVFFKYNQNVLEQTKLEYEQIKVYSLLATLPNHPILQYSSFGNSENALDTSKLLNVKLNDLGEKEIIVKQIYPLTQDAQCTPSNYPACNSYLIYSKRISNKNVNIISTPVSLYFPLTKEFKPGLLEIKWYY
ncbi:MAG: hypothetical protein QT11_C0001G0480 [archaeon GW2011_AR20]|nr:MAG: hypothetical protein QT11_C0001G0480 [archaeon GW2011_AR20]AQS28751.1 hypothetical protein [uncultured archaeon]MBS3160552.1 hypothetical protein [Candidatus Woesearchaeota archaeon]